jgi:hypothetical protein
VLLFSFVVFAIHQLLRDAGAMPGLLQDHASGKDAFLKADDKQDARLEESFPEQGQVQEYLVMNQEVTIDVDFSTQSIQGESRISIYCLNNPPPEEVLLDARQCNINIPDVTVNGRRAMVYHHDPYKDLDTPMNWDVYLSNYPILQNRMKELMPRLRRDLPLGNREATGCLPVDGWLRVSLRPGPQENANQGVIDSTPREDTNPMSASAAKVVCELLR